MHLPYISPVSPLHLPCISPDQVYFQIGFLLLSGLALAFQLDQWAANDWPVRTFLAVFGLGLGARSQDPNLGRKHVLGS